MHTRPNVIWCCLLYIPTSKESLRVPADRESFCVHDNEHGMKMFLSYEII